MAEKIRIMKMLQEIEGLEEVTHRFPPPRKPGLFLIKLRSHVLETRQSHKRQVIRVDMQDRLDVPHPVEITHLSPTPPACDDTTTYWYRPASQI